MRVLIFDSSSLISLAMNGLLLELEKLARSSKAKFVITSHVKREAIEKPLTIKRFRLEGIKLQKLLEGGILNLSDVVGVNNQEIEKETNKVMNIANSSFIGKDGKIHLIDKGEASCLALSKILNEKKVQNVLAIDERTMRMLCEVPENLKKLLKKKLHTGVEVKKENFEFFKGFKIIRSAELVYVAWKKKLIDSGDKKILDALLWAVRFKGCSISDKEIEEIKKIG